MTWSRERRQGQWEAQGGEDRACGKFKREKTVPGGKFKRERTAPVASSREKTVGSKFKREKTAPVASSREKTAPVANSRERRLYPGAISRERRPRLCQVQERERRPRLRQVQEREKTAPEASSRET